MADRLPPTRQDLIRWSEALSGIARTGLAFTQSLYEQERFEEVLHVAADIRASVEADDELDVEHYVDEWMRSVGTGVAGYVTPKAAVGAIVYDDQQRILLVQRADSGVWLYPTGWADVGYSASEVAVKEVLEETGITCVPERVVAVLDGMRMGFTAIPLYSIVFLCRATGGALTAHPLETSDVGWFAEHDMPPLTVGLPQWGAHAFAAVRGETTGVLFDEAREHPWHPG
ncbi:MAG: NUDIX hydrolase N-terminal domain-containing protein [Acidimicrobiales bacterium]|nr:NUDIX hydrolase N-terminal domain-containing protein [Acidimicrobiales bacterium]